LNLPIVLAQNSNYLRFGLGIIQFGKFRLCECEGMISYVDKILFIKKLRKVYILIYSFILFISIVAINKILSALAAFMP